MADLSHTWRSELSQLPQDFQDRIRRVAQIQWGGKTVGAYPEFLQVVNALNRLRLRQAHQKSVTQWLQSLLLDRRFAELCEPFPEDLARQIHQCLSTLEVPQDQMTIAVVAQNGEGCDFIDVSSGATAAEVIEVLAREESRCPSEYEALQIDEMRSIDESTLIEVRRRDGFNYHNDICSWPNCALKDQLLGFVRDVARRRLEGTADGTWASTREFAIIVRAFTKILEIPRARSGQKQLERLLQIYEGLLQVLRQCALAASPQELLKYVEGHYPDDVIDAKGELMGLIT